MSSRIPGFYRLTPEARLAAVASHVGLTAAELLAYTDAGLSLTRADAMIENVIGLLALPCGVAVNLVMNGRDRLVPMAVEEPSVVAAVSNMARIARPSGGITAEADTSEMIGQVQIIGPSPGAAERLRAALPRLTERCRGVHVQLEELGGGVRGMEVRELRYDEPGEAPEDMVVLHFWLDCVDAMGANMVNTLAERLAPEVANICGGTVGLRILSNLAERRLARATVRLRPEDLDPEDGAVMAEGIAAAYRFAYADPYRAATHNKGIMNGIDAVAIATGNDWRAIEAGAHAWAARSGTYKPLSSWKIDREGTLVGVLTLPLQVGTVGGATRVHPTVQANLKVAEVTGARDLACLMAAVGLVQNLGALRALATEGIQEGHMRMHARTVALGAGAEPAEVAAVVLALVATHEFTAERAQAELARLRAG
ncbi:MAG: hydroxymethylglutaryl-CoA reductase, degradative [Pseudomonadota bacterium]|nr:hydroxymethylglutaryl-CoA reductase, degradative [Pseudomonadota bacterium]